MGERVLVPRDALGDLRPDRFDPDRGLRQVGGHRRVRHDDRDRRVARNVAVVEAERARDRPRRHVVVHRHRVAVDRGRVARGVGAAVERDPARASRASRRSGAGSGSRSCRSSWRPTSRRTARAIRAAGPTRAARRIPPRPSVAYVDSHTVRKHSTCRHRPLATASIAAITEPPGPGRSPPPLIHVGCSRSASSTAVTPPSLMPMPEAAGVGRQPVDVVERRARRRRSPRGTRRR